MGCTQSYATAGRSVLARAQSVIAVRKRRTPVVLFSTCRPEVENMLQPKRCGSAVRYVTSPQLALGLVVTAPVRVLCRAFTPNNFGEILALFPEAYRVSAIQVRVRPVQQQQEQQHRHDSLFLSFHA